MLIARRTFLTSLGAVLALKSAQAADDDAVAQAASNGAAREGGILFIGSSIFQFWTHLGEQMAPLPVKNIAIAGTVTTDWLNRFGQVLRYWPRIVVYYCGSNDISGGDEAGPIVERTKRFAERLHEKLPETMFYYASINKAPEKRDRWDVVDAVNRAMQQYSNDARNIGYIELNGVLFDANGKVREELFLPDGLHFKQGGPVYPQFAAIVKPILTRAWESGAGQAR